MKILLWKRFAGGMDDMPQRSHTGISLNPLHGVSRHRHLLEIALGKALLQYSKYQAKSQAV